MAGFTSQAVIFQGIILIDIGQDMGDHPGNKNQAQAVCLASQTQGLHEQNFDKHGVGNAGWGATTGAGGRGTY